MSKTSEKLNKHLSQLERELEKAAKKLIKREAELKKEHQLLQMPTSWKEAFDKQQKALVEVHAIRKQLGLHPGFVVDESRGYFTMEEILAR